MVMDLTQLPERDIDPPAADTAEPRADAMEAALAESSFWALSHPL